LATSAVAAPKDCEELRKDGVAKFILSEKPSDSVGNFRSHY
jgi:hypothetical protein